MIKSEVPGGVPLVEPQVISGYGVPLVKLIPAGMVIVGVVVKVAAPVIFNGATVVLGVTFVAKLNVRLGVPAPLVVRLLQLHCIVLFVTDTPTVFVPPEEEETVTSLLMQCPPTTPINTPPLTIVAPA